MADKKLNEVTKVTDMAYVPVIMTDGSIGQIAKADLASVVAGHSIYHNVLSGITNLNDAGNGFWTLQGNSIENLPDDYGLLLSYRNPSINRGFQLLIKTDSSLMVRVLWNSWGEWIAL
jgi:hypothetical protein